MDEQTKSELQAQVIDILKNAHCGKGSKPGFLTAYQVFKRLPEHLRDTLVQDYGPPGSGSTSHYSAASRVAAVARTLTNAGTIETAYLDTGGLDFDVSASDDVEAGYPLCGIYRLVV